MAKADPFEAVRNFERELCEYTGAPHAVAVNSCTMALLLSCAYVQHTKSITPIFEIPKLTYVGVPMSIANARCGVVFRDDDWQGEYELRDVTVGEPPEGGVRIWDSARRFTSGMFGTEPLQPPGVYTLRGAGPRIQCVSFHVSKILGHTQGGAILHNLGATEDGYGRSPDMWFRRARFDGRREGVPPKADCFAQVGWHCYMSPDVAAALRWKLSVLPDWNPDLPRSDYPDLSKAPIFGG